MLQKNELSVMQTIAMHAAKSGLYKAQSEYQLFIKIMAGHEMGLPPITSMSGIHIVNGKATIGSNMIATLIKNSKIYDFKVIESTPLLCQLVFFENGKTVGKSFFTIEEAKKADLLSKETWKKYPTDMLFARALTRGARQYAAGIFGGSPVYTPEELGADLVDEDEDGNLIINNNYEQKNETIHKKESDNDDNDENFKLLIEDVMFVVKKAKSMGVISEENIEKLFEKEKVSDWIELSKNRIEFIKNYIQKKIDEKVSEKTTHENSENKLQVAFDAKTIDNTIKE